ncbi:MAG TPA: FKBP-type peptidyl-prolyl cis-trans isomerase [Solirubrobacterales bacterium]|nr:FKBP-type peptidyl-prolyl cis-trans isomerase [Solirubrobacterales bacterium]
MLGPEPRPLMPKGPPPEFLSSRDLIQGIGHLATPGKVITVQYVGAEYRTGRIFASSWKQGRPYTFRLGAGREIRGWEEGIEGMEVGDRRELVIPADLGYGGRRKGSIPPDSALVFVIDLLRVQ